MKIGAEDKKKVAILGGMLAVIIPVAVWELAGTFGGAPTPRPVPVVTPQRVATTTRQPALPAAATQAAAAPEAERLNGDNIDPTLHLDKLAQSEDIEYAGTGRNIFSAESAPKVPEPAAPARPANVDVAVNTPPPAPTAPPIDLKYFGYSQSRDKSNMHAFLIHGDDIFMAKTGEIVDHRYKVGAISPGSIQLTDLAYNNTQTLPLLQQ
jgi:hypothetical protein